MTTQTEALKALMHEMEYVLSCINEDKIPFDGDDFHEALRLGKEALAQPEQDLSEQGRNRSAVLGNNVEAMMDAGLPFLKALETTLKVYDHDVPKLGCVNHDCDKCKAQPEQEPVAWITQGGKGWLRWHKSYDDNKDSVPLYTTPPQRNPLTDEQRIKIVKNNTIQGYHGDYFDAWGIIDDVEAAHGIKGDV